MSDKKKFNIKKESKKFNIPSDEKKKFKIVELEDGDSSPKNEQQYYYREGLFSLKNLVQQITTRRAVNAAVKGVNTVFKMNRNGVSELTSTIVMFSGASQYFTVIKRGRVTVPTIALDCIIGEYGRVTFLIDMSIESIEPKKMVEELMIEQDPSGAIVREVGVWLSELLNDSRVDYLADFKRYKTRIQRGITDRAVDMGLKINVTNLQLKDGSITNKVYNIENNYVKIQLKNLNDFVEVKYQASIRPNKAQRVYAIRNRNKKNEIPLKITACLKTILRRYDFGALYSQELSELIEEFKEEINIMMEDERLGWQLDDFVIEFKEEDIEIPEYFLLENKPVEVHIRGENKSFPITVNNTLALNLESGENREQAARKVKSNLRRIKDLGTWLENLMKKVIHNSLMGVSYADLLINRIEYENLIRAKLVEETQKVGYSITNFMTIPEVEKGKLGNQFNFETDKDIEYRTKIDDIVKLQIIVQKIRIDELENIRSYLYHDVNIKEEMTKLVVQTTSNFLHDKDPDDYYIHFDQKMKQPLEEEIKQALKEEFHIDPEVIKIISKQIKTPLIEKYDALKGLYSFDFMSFGKLKYTMSFSINGIDPGGWVRFKELPFNSTQEQIDAIKQHLINFLEDGMNNNFTITLKAVKDPRYQKVMKKFFNAAVEHIKNKFGLIIEFTGRKRHKTSAEERFEQEENANLEIKKEMIEQRKKRAKQMAQDETERYAELKQELQLAKNREEEEEVRRIKKEIEAIKAESLNFDSLEDEIADLESEVDDTLDRLLEQDDQNLLE